MQPFMIPELGIIEGYFGRAWSWSDRAAVVSRLAPAGYRFFHHAPKIDARLRRDWQTLHSADDANAIAAFGLHCRALGVRFGIGLTPFAAHLDFNADVKLQLKAKLADLDRMGIEDLAILFDDMRGDIADLAQRQADIVSFCQDHSRATHLFICPSYYSHDAVLDRVFGKRPDNYLTDLGKMIDRHIPIYWTGEEVCAREYSMGHLRDVSDQLGRKLALWDNYPVNDGPRMAKHLHLRAFTGRPADAGQHVSHHAINPALQPILGCIPALTLPRRYQQRADYCYAAAFVAAAGAVCGPELALMLQQDLLTFEDGGLDQIGARRTALRARYAAIDHAAAREVVLWLDDGYAITGEMLQTQ